MSEPTATMHIDGASRGNPGPAAFAVVVRRPGHADSETFDAIGTATNNVAEYTALVRGLEKAADLGLRAVAVFSDSELLVKQMNGEYRVKSADLQGLYAEAQELRKGFDRVTFAHVRREQNKRADELCNKALDALRKQAAPKPQGPAPLNPQPPGGVVSDAAVRDDAVACLQVAAQAWAANGPARPPVGAVWEQLWSVLEAGGVLKRQKPR